MFLRLGHLDKPITVIAEINVRGKHNKFIIVDGYIRYLIAKQYGLEYIPVKYEHY